MAVNNTDILAGLEILANDKSNLAIADRATAIINSLQGIDVSAHLQSLNIEDSSPFEELYYGANLSPTSYDMMHLNLQRVIQENAPRKLLENANSFECLLAIYVLTSAYDSSDINLNIFPYHQPQDFFTKLSNLYRVNENNAPCNDVLEYCHSLTEDIVSLAHESLMGNKNSLKTLLDLKKLGILSYFIYVEGQLQSNIVVCNYTEFALPITCLLNTQKQFTQNPILPNQQRMRNLTDRIEENWASVASLVKAHWGNFQELEPLPENLSPIKQVIKRMISNDIPQTGKPFYSKS